MLVTQIFLYLVSFIVIWLGTGLIIKSVDRIAKKVKLSQFAISFFILGILTSIPEAAVSFNAVSEHNPEIFVGTLLGGVVVIFLLIIPFLAILGKGINLKHQLNRKNLLLTLTVIAAPSLFVIDQKVTNLEGLILVIFYLVLFYIIQRKHGIFDEHETEALEIKAYSFLDLIKVSLGVGLIFISSNYIVDQTIVFSNVFNVPTFYISLIILSLGTNLPELSLAIRAIVSGKKDIAMGDYLGSAAANTLLFGFFTLLNNGEVITVNNFLITFIFMVLGLGLFYYFSKPSKSISVKNGIILFAIYLIFIIFELGKEVLK